MKAPREAPAPVVALDGRYPRLVPEIDAMNLTEAIERLRRAPRDPAAVQVLYDAVCGRFTRTFNGAVEAEDAAHELFLALLDKLERGEEIRKPQAYLAKCARTALAQSMRGRRHRSLEEVGEHGLPRHEDGEGGGPRREADSVLPLLERLVGRAREARPSRHREAFDGDWAQVRALVFAGRPLGEIIAEVQGERSWSTAANAVYKRHERFRKALHEALSSWDELGGEDREFLEALLPRLVYCQKSGRPPSKG